MELKEIIIKIIKKTNVYSNISGVYKLETNEEQIKIVKAIKRLLRKKEMDLSIKETKVQKLMYKYNIINNDSIREEKSNIEGIKEICISLINFFKDVEFEPNFRFINTLSLKNNIKDSKKYIVDYFKLIDNYYQDDIAEKIKSEEFEKIIKKLQEIKTNKKINNRFKLYYGSAGTGKTTKALEESSNLCIVCNSTMLPNDLLEDFSFDDGKPGFHPSQLVKCMEEGKPITLDEINLLPYESLRFLQGILDNKTEINHKGQIIHIKEGFKVIGTMNLKIGGSIFGLPEPLVDRAEDLKEFKLTADQLIGALI